MKVNITVLNELLLKIKNITKIEDVVCHEIKNGALNPIHKLDSDELTSEKWKQAHSQLDLKVDDIAVLQSIVNDKKTIYMHNVAEAPDAPEVFATFGLKTVLIIPLIINNKAIGFVEAASIKAVVDLSEDQIHTCEALVHEFSQNLI